MEGMEKPDHGETENTGKYKKIGGRVIRSMVLLTIALILAASGVVAFHFDRQLKTEYSSFAHDYARSVAEYIDGDRVPHYLETGLKDDYYKEVEGFIDILLEESNLLYLYVFVPRENDLVYVWDGNAGDGVRDDLGVVSGYVKGDKELIERTFRIDYSEQLMIYPEDGFATVFVPLFNSSGTPVALVGADFEIEGIMENFRNFQITVSVSILIVSIIFMILFYLQMNRGIIRPIGQLNRAARELISHLDEKDERFTADIHTGDEIEELAHNFEKMDEGLREYIQQIAAVTAERERIGAELDLANTIQSAMLPRIFPPFPERKEFEIYASMTPAREVGGDFYDFFLIDDDHLGLVMADASGKGVGAALFMAVSKVRIKDQALLGGMPAEVLTCVNNQFCEGEDAGMFVTVWLGIYTISTGEIICANAGHEYPALCRRDEGFFLVKTKHGPPVGIYEGVVYENEHLRLEQGETLFLYTDGVPEATRTDGEMFGEERMVELLQGCREAEPEELLRRAKEEVDRFVGGAEPFDDLTMLAFRRR